MFCGFHRFCSFMVDAFANFRVKVPADPEEQKSADQRAYRVCQAAWLQSTANTIRRTAATIMPNRMARFRSSGERPAAAMPIIKRVVAGQNNVCDDYSTKIANGFPHQAASARIKSETRSPIMMQGALVLPDTITGMMEASATRKFPTPWTRNRSSTTAIGSDPILQVPVGW